MFSPDELFDNGNYLATYSGYTYTGERIKSKDSPSFDDFFTKRDENGMYTREIAPFTPIYMAGYIQDKFAFDLIFNVGVRVDRFDANQQVLTDPYTLYPAKTVGEVNDLGSHPKIWVATIQFMLTICAHQLPLWVIAMVIPGTMPMDWL